MSWLLCVRLVKDRSFSVEGFISPEGARKRSMHSSSVHLSNREMERVGECIYSRRGVILRADDGLGESPMRTGGYFDFFKAWSVGRET